MKDRRRERLKALGKVIYNGAAGKMVASKKYGQFFTPESVASTLVKWAVSGPQDHILDPACGNGEFLWHHRFSVGVEIDPVHATIARERAATSPVYQQDFFSWAEQTEERFDAVVGNPPFIRYHGFTGETRTRALRLALRIGAKLPQLTSSWAPFLAVAAGLLKPGGRMAFVVPAEIGHAKYAVPLLWGLARSFSKVQVIAVKHKMFPRLSEDAWLLYTEGFGGKTDHLDFTVREEFFPWENVPKVSAKVSLDALKAANGRLRRWILPTRVLSAYEELEGAEDMRRLGSVAEVGIGYVTGANAFFHLRPSEARTLEIPPSFLKVSVRKGEYLPVTGRLMPSLVERWLAGDEPVLLLHIEKSSKLPLSVEKYLSTERAKEAQKAFKCAVRNPWYVVPNVTVPHGFLSYMSGSEPRLVENSSRCVATNSVHTVRLKDKIRFGLLQEQWQSPVTRLSCEIEGHPLGGGMLKLEPGEAKRVLLPDHAENSGNGDERVRPLMEQGIEIMHGWRHYNKTVEGGRAVKRGD